MCVLRVFCVAIRLAVCDAHCSDSCAIDMLRQHYARELEFASEPSLYLILF